MNNYFLSPTSINPLLVLSGLWLRLTQALEAFKLGHHAMQNRAISKYNGLKLRPGNLFCPKPFGNNDQFEAQSNRAGARKMPIAMLILVSLASSPANAHRGAGDEIDTCQIQVGSEKVHFTAYTPTFTQNQDYCKSIPNVGPTNLVFDYEGKKLRNISVEFEVTKEPDGTRVFYQEPQKIKTGTVNGQVDFSQFGAGKYLAHVTIDHNGEKLDTHLPFWVGVEAESDGLFSNPLFGKLLLTFTIIAALVYFLTLLYRAKSDQDSTPEQPK
ncbi:MAG: hypothetical protein ACU85E_12490 [Gammaproteobacteria bacterium]